MKKILLSIIIVFSMTLSSCSTDPILSDLGNTRMNLVLKGTYESNDPYAWNTNIYNDDSISGLSGMLLDDIPWSDVSMYIDIADLRLAYTEDGTGKPADVAPEDYWTYFTKKREVFCSTNTASGHDLITCVNDNGDLDYQDFFSEGYSYPATDVPVGTYNHLAINFRKLVTSPSYEYDSSNNVIATARTTFDNRTIYGLNLMDSIIQYTDSDSSQASPLMFPLERKDLSLNIPEGNDSYVLEVRVFLKNLLMKHYIQDGSQLPLQNSGDQVTFIGPSDWKTNHATYDAVDTYKPYQMGGHIIFTARVYDPATVGSISVVDSEALPEYKSYYAVLPAGNTFPSIGVLPYAATSRVATVTGSTGEIKNLPAGNYDVYKTCDKKLIGPNNVEISGEDGYPESVSSTTVDPIVPQPCASNVAVTAGTVTSTSITCSCP